MAYENSVLTEVRRKTSGGFETPVKLGSEQRFVSALLNTHNNNLEEQSIMGLDNLQVTWDDEITKVKYTTTKFYNGDISSVSSNGYYVLFVSDYSESEVTADFYFAGVGMYLPEEDISSAKFQLEGDGSYSLLMDEPSMYTFEEDTQALKINPSFRVMRREVLCLRKDLANTSDERISSDIIVSEKTIAKKIDDNGKVYFRTAIVNKLN